MDISKSRSTSVGSMASPLKTKFVASHPIAFRWGCGFPATHIAGRDGVGKAATACELTSQSAPRCLLKPPCRSACRKPPPRRSADVFALSLLLVLGRPAVVVLFLIRKSAAFFAFRPKLDIGNPVVIQDASQPKRSNIGVESNYYFVRQTCDEFRFGFWSLQNLIFECLAFGVVFLEPGFRGVDICKHLEMLGIADLFACIHVNEDACHWTLLSFRRPQCVSLRDGSNVRSTLRFNALDRPMRAIMIGPLSSTTRSRASTAACHSSCICSATGSFWMYSAASRRVTS